MQDGNRSNHDEGQAVALPSEQALVRFGPTDTRMIVINGRSHTVLGSEIGRKELAALAFPNAVPGSSGVLTIAYDRGPSAAPSGLIATDSPVRVLDGQTFSVTLTDKS